MLYYIIKEVVMEEQRVKEIALKLCRIWDNSIPDLGQELCALQSIVHKIGVKVTPGDIDKLVDAGSRIHESLDSILIVVSRALSQR